MRVWKSWGKEKEAMREKMQNNKTELKDLLWDDAVYFNLPFLKNSAEQNI